MHRLLLKGNAYVNENTSETLITSDLKLSFWGGVDPQTGEIIDHHHALHRKCLQDAILAIPGGRGSCTGSSVMLELLLNNKGPRGLIFQRREDILTLGVIVAEEIFGRAIPVIVLAPDDFRNILGFNRHQIYINGPCISDTENITVSDQILSNQTTSNSNGTVAKQFRLSKLDAEFAAGAHGEAARAAFRIILRMADLMGATELMNITQLHIDSCIYTWPGSLQFAEKLRGWGGRVRVLTTLNSISIDQKRWRSQGVDVKFGEEAKKLAIAFTDMGAKPTFTCAPYQLESAPEFGEQVAWANSNAVVYANSVLGARTMKYPDFLDVAIALTGRAPKGGAHIETNRRASLVVQLPMVFADIDDSFYPVLGYCVGSLAPSQIPVVAGLESLAPSRDDLKTFGAAFATVSSAPMFHIVGVTPEATSLDAILSKDMGVSTKEIELGDLMRCWNKFNCSPATRRIDLVSLGNPHFSFSEIKKLAKLCEKRKKDRNVSFVVTCGRATYGLATQAGFVQELEEFGVQFVNDTCWCMITEPVIPP